MLHVVEVGDERAGGVDAEVLRNGHPPLVGVQRLGRAKRDSFEALLLSLLLLGIMLDAPMPKARKGFIAQ